MLSLADAVEGVCAQITQVCNEWPERLLFVDGSSVKFTSIKADEAAAVVTV